jgi:hypothetical protein
LLEDLSAWGVKPSGESPAPTREKEKAKKDRAEKEKSAAVLAAAPIKRYKLGADSFSLADQVDGFLHVVMSLVDVVQGALLETLSEAVVFFAGDVVVRLVE